MEKITVDGIKQQFDGVFTVEELERDFDAILERVENGEVFLISVPDGKGYVALIPYSKELIGTGEAETP